MSVDMNTQSLPNVVERVRKVCADSNRSASRLQRGMDVRVVLTLEDFAWLAVAFDLDRIPTPNDLSTIIQSGLAAAISKARKEADRDAR